MIIYMFLMVLSFCARAEQVTVSHAHTQKIGMRIAYVGATAEQVASVVAADIASSGYYAVEVREYTEIPRTKKDITDLVNHNILFLLILESHTTMLGYRLYDTTTGLLIKEASGKCVVHNNTDTRYGHHIADGIWRYLMGSPSIFNTQIAYAKEVSYKQGIAVKYICIADYDGKNERVMVSKKTICIAPRWGGTQENPLLFYSEYTPTNIRLMAVDAHKRTAIVTRYDGTNMHLTPSHDRSKHAFSASHGTGKSNIYVICNKELMQCTCDDASDACPTFNHDGSVLYYCSDAKTGIPHIMSYTFATKKHEALPIQGYCVTPAYNPAKNLIAYSKMVDGCMQIFVFNIITLQEKQITWDNGHHEDPTWSPCGNFIAYTHQVGTASRIRMHCYATGHEQYVTAVGINCSYPAWSLWC